MAVFPEEQAGLDRRDAGKQKPADLLARSGLPVPDFRSSDASDIGAFNADFRRLVARISKLFSIIAPTVQTATPADTTTLAAHRVQHEAGGTDEINVTGLSGLLNDAQTPLVHDIQGAKHSAAGLTPGHVMRATAPTTFAFGALQAADVPASLRSRTIGLVLDGSSVSTGQKGYVRTPFSGTIVGWTVMADTVGSIVVDIWKDTFGAFPPIVGDSIVGAGNKPTLASAQSDTQSPVGWTTVALTAGDVIAFNVESTAGLGRVTLQLEVQI